ncbi:hypothetical protein EVAR_76418_1 [Eumeta japonica]|uniref:Uncharacterized protein n=1 Tax=Eumeta variegata TaxID=151549 RepID=A0A4C1T7V1_EUMVA|nr:hypothetical protein EVAR_76418_1 [Eumeta japonica]
MRGQRSRGARARVMPVLTRSCFINSTCRSGSTIFPGRRRSVRAAVGRRFGVGETSRDVISDSGVFYQYREGFNNAVRRSVRTRDLL